MEFREGFIALLGFLTTAHLGTPWKDEEGKVKRSRKSNTVLPKSHSRAESCEPTAAAARSSQHDARHEELRTLLSQFELQNHLAQFIAHELWVPELSHWSPGDLARLLHAPAAKIRQMLSALQDAQDR